MDILEAMEDYFHYISVVDQKSLATIASYRRDLTQYREYLASVGVFTATGYYLSDLTRFFSFTSR